MTTTTLDLAAIEARLRTRLAALTADIDAIEATKRAPLDADFSEQATELEDTDALGGIQDSKLMEVDGINAALGRIAAGTYGQCSKCGCPIPPARMAAMPTATECVDCRC